MRLVRARVFDVCDRRTCPGIQKRKAPVLRKRRIDSFITPSTIAAAALSSGE